MLHIVLVHPEIPPNTGNIIRLAANTGCALHLVEPLGFEMCDRRLRRAGLDYHEWATVATHPSWEAFLAEQRPSSDALFAATTHGGTTYSQVTYPEDAWFVFGSETTGFPPALEATFEPPQRIRIPMLPTQRSLNLCNAVAVVVYEAWRQRSFAGGV